MEAGEDSDVILEARELLRTRLFSTNGNETEGGFLSNKSTPQSRKNAYSEIREKLEHTILYGYGCSMIVIGPAGSGKTWLVNEVLRDLDSTPGCCGNFLVVRLSGLVHVDDYQALLAAAAQLSVEMGDKIKMPFSTALDYFLERLRKGTRGKKSIVFVVDNFELFTQHKNQILLYSLFQTTQTNHNPIAVICLTRSLDGVEMLEKRNKSRLSLRKVFLFFDYSLEDYVDICKDLLSLPANFKNKRFLKRWKAHVEKLCQDPVVKEQLRQVYHLNPSVQRLKLFLSLPVSSLSEEHIQLEPRDFSHAFILLSSGHSSKASFLRELSVLELTLVIAMHHITELSDHEPFNFEMVYSEYKKFAHRSQSVKLFSKPVSMKAFEHLVDLGFVHLPRTSGCGGHTHLLTSCKKATMKEYCPVVLRGIKEEILEAVKTYPNCPTELSRWALTKSIRS